MHLMHADHFTQVKLCIYISTIYEQYTISMLFMNYDHFGYTAHRQIFKENLRTLPEQSVQQLPFTSSKVTKMLCFIGHFILNQLQFVVASRFWEIPAFELSLAGKYQGWGDNDVATKSQSIRGINKAVNMCLLGCKMMSAIFCWAFTQQTQSIDSLRCSLSWGDNKLQGS